MVTDQGRDVPKANTVNLGPSETDRSEILGVSRPYDPVEIPPLREICRKIFHGALHSLSRLFSISFICFIFPVKHLKELDASYEAKRSPGAIHLHDVIFAQQFCHFLGRGGKIVLAILA